MKELDDIKYNIEEIEKTENDCKYKIKIQVPITIGWIERMKFITEANDGRRAYQLKHIKNDDNYVYFETELSLPTKALYHYYFSFEANHRFIYYKKENRQDINHINQDEMWKLSVNFKTPDWAKGKIMYHVFVDRFNRGNPNQPEKMKNRSIYNSWDDEVKIGPDENGIWNADFYGGDIKGITEKLDYIESLGVSIIYLSPIVWSQSNHRYDSADYKKVDPYAGTNKDLKELCDKAHEKGIKIVLDAVFNHTGNDSKYFNQYNNFETVGAYQSENSKYYDFYRKYIYNNKPQFDYWWGMTNLPVCDGNSKIWQDYIYGEGGVIDLWFQLGIDGLRLDVADELTDEFIEGIRKAVKRNKEDGFILGEVWKNPMRMNRSYIESGKGMDSVMNYLLIDALIRYFKYSDTYKLREIINQIEREYPKETIDTLMNFTSTHDITRAINIFGTNEFQYSGEWAWNLQNDDRNWQNNYKLNNDQYNYSKEVYKSYIATLAFLPGILSIFYGDEVGVEGMGNLSNRKPFPWTKKDTELLEFFRTIGKIRKKESFLETADLKIYDINNNYFQFERTNNNEKALITVNRTDYNTNFYIPDEYNDSRQIYSLNNSNKYNLNRHGVLVLKK